MKSTDDSPERRVRRGCIWPFILLIVITPISYVENGLGVVTIVLGAMLLFNLVMLIVVNLPDKET